MPGAESPPPHQPPPPRQGQGQGGQGQSGTALRERPRAAGRAQSEKRAAPTPPKYNVVLYNDDFTPMQFVTALLQQLFRKPPVEANALMLRIHRSGRGVAGRYPLDVAETKVAAVHAQADRHGFPLRAGVEEA